jgi:hypothetical protein
VESLPEDTSYFHARYRQEYPARPGDYVIADLEGTGKYVGTVMSVTLAQDGWFGEGDDFFYIDGEEVPSLQGTGSEDYFNDAWGFRERTSAWFGQPRWQGDEAGDSGVCYRWHVLDPVCFRESLKVTMEHKGNRGLSEDAWYLERPDFFNSVAFWYQTGEPKPWPRMPDWHERRMPWAQYHLVSAFRQADATAGDLRVRTEGFFGGRPTLVWEAPTGASLTVPFSVNPEGRHAVRLIVFARPGGGRFDISVDGQQVLGNVDLTGENFRELDIRFGELELSAGEHRLTFRAIEAGLLSGEMLRLLRLPPAAERPHRGEGEAHFYRLGIGRATYAYRLAYGTVPDSLEELVKSGIMPERYLRDENGLPVRCHREGDALVVESTAPNGWKQAFRGLDPRR